MQKIVNLFFDIITSVKSFLFMLLAVAIFIITGVAAMSVCNHPNNNKTTGWNENVGTICEITNKVPYVNHTVEGFTYENCELDVYSDELKVGIKIKIKYNPANPYEISGKNEDKTIGIIIYSISFTVAALIPVCYFGTGIYRYCRRKKAEKQLEQNIEE